MWKRLTLALCAAGALAACDRTTLTAPDEHRTSRGAPPGQLVEIEVKFREDIEARLDASGRLRGRAQALVRVQAALDRHAAREVRPLVTLAPERLGGLVAEARARSDEPVPDMLAWYRITVRDGAAPALLAELQALPEVEHAYLAPQPAPPPGMVSTPDFTWHQSTYFGPAPQGTETEWARAQPGGRGAGVMLVDLEYDWHLPHEDLVLPSWIQITGERYTYFGPDHGTAVLGVLVGRQNGFGVTGGVPDATIRIAGAFQNGGYNPAQSITNVASTIGIGDVLLLEQQAVGPEGPYSYVPLEWIPAVFDAIRLATAAGRIVVAAAGNGDVNLDSPIYGGRFDRNQYDSRAIIVGAAGANNARLSFSTYGSRVDVHARGTGVTTTGYSGLYGWSLDNYYTGGFNGTSSASAIVAASVTAVQSYQKHHGRPVLSAVAMANLLRATGTPQTGNTSQNIGPQPNLKQAFTTLSTYLPPTVSIIGPRYINQPGAYTWYADASGANWNYTYRWYRSPDEVNWTLVETSQAYTEFVHAADLMYLRVEVVSAGLTGVSQTPVVMDVYCNHWTPCTATPY